LDDLLKLVSRDVSILHESDDYLVLNKPPDLRMDGPFPSTVQKLLHHWYNPPPPAAIGERVAPVVEKFRPCHQLDYATSGVLLVARNAISANRAREMFEGRHPGLRKSYVAVVRGHVTIPTTATTTASQPIPVLSKHEIHARLSRLEDSHRKSQRKRHRKPHTFQGTSLPTRCSSSGVSTSSSRRHRICLRRSSHNRWTRRTNRVHPRTGPIAIGTGGRGKRRAGGSRRTSGMRCGARCAKPI
jgi:RNA pseudouridylate synthase